jgi:L-arabinose transport system substrate-binding protein
MSRFPRTPAVATALIAASMVLASCSAVSSGKSDGASDNGRSAKESGEITIAYLQKQGDQQYFVDEAQGAKDMAEKLGDVTVKVIDLGTDANKAISELNAVIAQGVDGIAIVVPDQQIGPQVIDAAEQAGIPLVASDDAIESGEGEPAPFVGFNGRMMGEEVGKKAGELFKQAGWKLEDTAVIEAWKQDLQTCSDRVAGAEDAFKEATGGKLPKQIKLGTDNSATDALNKAGAALTANQDVKHWLVWGCNDENETGVVTALQNGGVEAADIIGVGLGAYLTCKDWKAGQKTGNKAALYIGGPAVGGSAVKVLVEAIRSGSPLPPETIADTQIVDATNWERSGLVCT